MRPLEREHLGMLGCQGWRIVDPGENKPPPAAVRRPAAFPDRAQDADGFSRRPTG
jgi:hypothetical protein